MDGETYQTLLEFTDFVIFKDAMLAQKAQLNQDPNAQGTQAKLEDPAAFDEFYFKISSEDIDDPANGWRVRMNLPPQNNMHGTVYSKPVDGYPVEWVHSDVMYDGISLEVWLKTCSDMHRMFSGHNQHQDLQVLSKHPDGMPNEIYNRLTMGMFMSDRDNLFKMSWDKMDDGSMLVMMRSYLSEDYPVNDDCVRIRFFLCQRAYPVEGGLRIRTF